MRANQAITRPGVLDSGYDYLIAAVLAVAAVAGAGTWATGQLAGLLFRGTWPPVSFGQALGAAAALPRHLGDPRQAWPPAARADLPGLAGFTVAAVLVAAVVTAAAWLAARQVSAHRPQRGMATPVELRRSLSEAAVVARGPVIRPGLAGQTIRVTDVGVRIGRSVPARER